MRSTRLEQTSPGSFGKTPGDPHSPELTLVVNRLRLMPLADRHILVCTRRAREWRLAKMPAQRGARLEISDDRVFDNYEDGVWEVFRMRWKTLTGKDPA